MYIGKLLLDYAFPEGVINSSSVYLNDLVVDHEDGGFAYISDNDPGHPGILVFSLRKRSSWKITHQSMFTDPDARDVVVNSTHLTVNSNINGIALSPASTEGRGRTLFYSPLSSYEIFALPTFVLKNPRNRGLVNKYVKSLGRKPSPGDGMTMSSAGVLYFGLLQKNAIGAWDIRDQPFSEKLQIMTEDPELVEWPDSFAIDSKGRLWNTVKRQSVIRTSGLDQSVPNFGILRTDIGAVRGYQYYEDGSAPGSQEIEESETLFGKLMGNLGHAIKHLRRNVLSIPPFFR